MDGLGAYIRQLRDERDISLREFAKQLELSAAFISDIELGRRHPSDEVLTKIAHALGVKVDDLRQKDTRAPLEDIKRITQSDPRFAFAFRTMIDKKVSAEEILEMVKKIEMDTRLAEAFARRIALWMQTGASHAINADLTTQLEEARELMREIMAEGVESTTRKYAVIQMSHALRDAISRWLTAQGHEK